MDTKKLLDILGNEGRRKILSLLSKKPCYVSEISYCLKMAPKVVIEHLEKLERAGIIKSFEYGRRRYYYIDKSLRLEITLTPHRFNVKVVEDGSIDRDVFDTMREIMNFNTKGDILKMLEVVSKIEDIQDTFSRIQYYINSKIDNILEELFSTVERFTSDEVEKIVLYGLAKGLNDYEIAESFGLFYSDVESALRRLEEKGLIKRVVEGERVVWKFGR